MGYSIGTSNYLKIIAISDLTHMMTMADPVAIDVKTQRIDNGCYLDKDFTQLIYMNL